MATLSRFKSDTATFQRLHTLLSQIFDYGNGAIEGRFLFYKRLSPPLEFGREREGIDLSQVKLTHHNLKNEGRRDLLQGQEEAPKLNGAPRSSRARGRSPCGHPSIVAGGWRAASIVRRCEGSRRTM